MRRIVLFLYGLLATISIALGSLYLFSPTFMPYHSVAIGREWSALTSYEQTLFSAFLDLAGSGWVAVGVAVMWLAMVPIRRGERWARILAPLLLVISFVPTFLATISVLQNTPADPPWPGILFVLATIGVAVLLDRPFQSNNKHIDE